MQRVFSRLVCTSLLASSALVGGCLAGDATNVDAAGGDSSGEITPEGDDTFDDDGSTSSGIDPTSNSGDTTGLSTTDEPGGSEGPGAEPCELAACDPGVCVIDGDGQPTCECPEDSVNAGLQCLTCEGVTAEFDVTIAAVDISLGVTFGGAEFPVSTGEQGRVWLRDPGNGELIVLGNPAEGLRTARVVPRVYEVVYGHLSGSVVPANKLARIGIVDANDTPMVGTSFDIPTVQLTGTFEFNGASAAGLGEYGNLWLRNPSTGDEVFLGRSDGGEYSVTVIPGDYEVHFEWLTGSGVAPANTRGLVSYANIPADQGPQVLPIDVLSVQVSGAFTFDGNDAPTSPSERASFFFHDPVTGDEFPIGASDGSSYLVRVIPGLYDLVLSSAGGAVAPANSRAILRTLDTADDSGHAIDVATSRVTGAITVDDGPAPADPADDGRLLLRGTTPGDEVVLGSTVGGDFDVVVVAGSYAVHYAQDTSSGTVPLNTNARIGELDATIDTLFDVDVPTAFVSGVITIGAGAPPDSDYDDGWVYLRNPETGDTVLLASTRMGQFAAPVVPGTYEVTYAVETAGGEAPISAQPIRLFDIDVDGDTAFDIDVPAQSLSGTIGSAAEAGDRAALFLRATTGKGRSLLGDTAAASYEQRIVPGRYIVAYGLQSGGGALPRNTDAALACIELTGR